MSIAVISDLHVHNFKGFGGPRVSGVNYRCHLSIVSIHRAVEHANVSKCTDLFVAGDLFDVSDPPPQVVAAVIAEFRQFKGNVHILVGNHDQFSLAEGDHALGPMSDHRTAGQKGAISIYEEATLLEPIKLGKDTAWVLAAPFRPEPVADWLPQLFKEHSGSFDTFFAHFGIIDDETPKYLRAAPDAYPLGPLLELMEKHKVSRTIVGNWHEHTTWRVGPREVIQVGALTPTGFNNLGLKYGRVVLLESGSLTRVHTVPGPRFWKRVYPDLYLPTNLPIDEPSEDLDFLHVEAEPKDLLAARAHLKELQQKGEIAGFELVPNKEKAKQQARKAARATSQVAALKDAVGTYVGSMPLEKGVAREKVLSLVHGYLKR